MTKQEFEKLAGETVNHKQYYYIEIMYYCCDLNKADFVEEWKKCKDSIVLNSLISAYGYLEERKDEYKREASELRQRIQRLEALKARFKMLWKDFLSC